MVMAYKKSADNRPWQITYTEKWLIRHMVVKNRTKKVEMSQNEDICNFEHGSPADF